ncbi:MAG: DUF2267 domain-containing protein [Spirochaetota bacterium]
MSLDFDKYAQEGNEFMNRLTETLGHPEEKAQAAILLRAVLHALRDRISVAENLHVISQLPMFLKAVYVSEWSYSDDVDRVKTEEEFTKRIEHYQQQYGEQDFNWEAATAELATKVFAEIERYLTEGEIEDIKSQLPEEIGHLV